MTSIDDIINPEDEYTPEEEQYDLIHAALDFIGASNIIGQLMLKMKL